MMIKNLYIHIPFCRSKCDYCAFFSITDTTDCDNFLKKLIADIEKSIDLYGNKFETLYIGGGTPTLLRENQLEFLFAQLDKLLNLKNFKEISIESNPETITREKLAIIGSYANRLSMGVQSFNANLRQILGRNCSNQAIYQAIELINNSSIKNFNIDLIYAIPSQTIEDFEFDLEQVKKANAHHLSCYNLTIEEQTKLASRDIVIDENLAVELYQTAINNPYYQQYEVSNYATSPEFQCLHNKNIWQGDTLLGFGPAASSFDGENRFTQSYSLIDYMQDKNIDYDIISPEERRNEIFAVNLRTCKGWEREIFEKKYPDTFDFYIEKIKILAKVNPNFFDYSSNHIRLTPKGLLFWDEIASELL